MPSIVQVFSIDDELLPKQPLCELSLNGLLVGVDRQIFTLFPILKALLLRVAHEVLGTSVFRSVHLHGNSGVGAVRNASLVPFSNVCSSRCVLHESFCGHIQRRLLAIYEIWYFLGALAASKSIPRFMFMLDD